MAPEAVEGTAPAKIRALHDAYPTVWAKFLAGRWAQAEELAAAVLRSLSVVPSEAKDAETWAAEGDFWYIAGAVRGNEAAALGVALEAYAQSLRSAGGQANGNAHRMRGEALLRLRRYEDAAAEFAAVAEQRGSAPAWEAESWHSLEVAPFRLRHDAAQCEKLAELGRLDPGVAGRAAAALRRVAEDVEALPQERPERPGWPLVEDIIPSEVQLLREGLFDDLSRQARPYPAERLAAWAAPLAAPPEAARDPLNPRIDWAKVCEEYSARNLVVVDDFFSEEALEELWTYSREAPVFRTVRSGFLGAFPSDGNLHPLILATATSMERHMPSVLQEHPLGLWWLFKYTEASPRGIGIHADVAAVNVNIWLTPDEARRRGGGLDVFTKVPPREDGLAWRNKEFDSLEEEEEFRRLLLASGPAEHVDYRRNRAVIFVSDLFHASEPFEFANPTSAPRVNLTLLFGDRPLDRSPETVSPGGGGPGGEPTADGSSVSKRAAAAMEPDWDLFS